MVNSEDFILRLEELMRYYDLNASSLADAIGVQRSSISHLISGRNKPSLDFIMKILQQFPDVNLYWLLNGKGQMIGQAAQAITPKAVKPEVKSPGLFDEVSETASAVHSSTVSAPSPTQTQRIEPSPEPKSVQLHTETPQSGIDRIVIFYRNGTFEEFFKN